MEKKKHPRRSAKEEFLHAWNTKRGVTVVSLILRLSVILVLIAQVFNRNYENVFLCVLTLFLFTMPTMLERNLRIDFPDTLEIIILLFIFAAEILGEINSFYIRVPNWDTMLHTLNGFLCAAIGFALVDMLNRSDSFSFKLSPVYLAIVAFCFSMTVGVLWEFFEYSGDRFLGYDMQKDTIIHTVKTVELDPTRSNKIVTLSDIADVIIVHSDGTQEALGLGGYLDVGINDTMKDLMVNFVGAVVFSIIGYFYVKEKGKGRFAARFIPRVLGVGESHRAEQDARKED